MSKKMPGWFAPILGIVTVIMLASGIKSGAIPDPGKKQ
jgi:hypothetical protein